MRIDVHEKIQQDIVGGEFQAGEPMVELALAQRYDVSRTPIREALRRLQADGLVEQFARGYRVTQHKPEAILDIYEVRIALEQAAAKAAAERRTPFDLARIRHAHQSMVEITTKSPGDASTATHAFHQAIWKSSHNSTLISTLTSLQRRVAAFTSTTLTFPGRSDQAILEHAGMLEAIEHGDADTASTLAGEHMIRSRNIRVKLYTEAPG